MNSRLAVILALATAAYGQDAVKPVANVAPLAVAFPAKKTWFASIIGDKVFVGGRPTERAVKYLGEEGFKSIITIGSSPDASTFGAAPVPSTADEEKMAFNSGLDFIAIDDSAVAAATSSTDANSAFAAVYANFKAQLETATRPTYVHDDENGAVAALFVSLAVLKDAAKVAAFEEQHRFGWCEPSCCCTACTIFAIVSLSVPMMQVGFPPCRTALRRPDGRVGSADGFPGADREPISILVREARDGQFLHCGADLEKQPARDQGRRLQERRQLPHAPRRL
jgi:hypothetical protein